MMNRDLLKLKHLLGMKNLAKAKKLALQLYKGNSGNEQILKACVLVFAKAKEFKQAIYFADKLLSKEPGNYGYVSNLANWCLALGQPERAAAYYHNYISDHPDNSKAYFQLGMIYKQEPQYEQTIQMFEAAIQKGFMPLEECYLNLALCYGEFRKEEKAIACLEQALKINPRHQIARLNLATLLQASGSKFESEQLYREVLSQDPSFTEALVRLLYLQKIKPADMSLIETAKTRLASQLSSADDKESLSYALGKAFDDLEDYSQAFDYYREANKFQESRIGRYDPSKMTSFVTESIQGISADWLSRSENPSRMEPVFIVGHFRSGSTLVEQILAGHSAIKSLGEVDYFIRLLHEKGDLLSSLYASDKPDVLQELSSGYESLIKTMSGNIGRITDKRPDNLLMMGLIKKLFPRARFIHTQRNLLDNAVSVYFQQLNSLSQYASSFESFADYDAQCQRLMHHWQSIFASSIYTINYEKLVNNPETYARELVAFLDLDWEPGCLDFAQRKNFVRTASVSQVREKIYTSSVGRGQNYYEFLTDIEKACYC